MKRILLWCLPALWVLMSNCTKEPLENLSTEESRLYITNYDNTAPFNTYRTFTITDSVAVVLDNRLQGKQRNSVDAQFVTAFSNALQARGFVRVNRDENPDLGVTLSRVTNTSTNLFSYTDYGNYYGSYWDPYYWDYPGSSYYFPTYYGTYETRETVLSIDIFDLKNVQNNQIRAVWSGMIRGSGIFNAANAESQVAALLNQSTYLKNQ